MKKIKTIKSLLLILYASFLTHSSAFAMDTKMDYEKPPYTTFSIPDKKIGNKKWVERERNQEQVGSCTAFAVTHCLEYVMGIELSASYLYIKTRKNGGNIIKTIDVAKENGIYHEDVIDDNNFAKLMQAENNNQNSSEEFILNELINKERKKNHPNLYKFNNVYSIKKIEDSDQIKTILIKYELPVVIGNGSHAVACYGYDDQKEVFVCKNSWGPRNGRYFEIKYKEVIGDQAGWGD